MSLGNVCKYWYSVCCTDMQQFIIMPQENALNSKQTWVTQSCAVTYCWQCLLNVFIFFINHFK